MELWIPITEYQNHIFSGDYEVSNWGNIKNSKTGRILSPSKTREYLKIKLKDEKGEIAHIKIHRLVAFYFLPSVPNAEKLEVNHKDGNPKNNSYSNLEWVTHEENVACYQDERRAREFLKYKRLKQQEFIFEG